MKLTSLLPSISVALLASTASALNPLVIKGNKFFDAVTGDQFFIKGVAYQPSGQTGPNKDPLSNIETCKRDIAYFKDLGLNTIRVYEVDNTLNHDACMSALADAGIYLVLDISTPKYSINRLNPVYDLTLLNHYKKTVDAFANYSNVLGFFAGNEVVNQVNATPAAPMVKASIRDLKQYMKTKERYIPIGYSTSDDATIRVDCGDYFNCGSEDERIDFYGYNLYSWCGDEATFQSSQYAARTEQFATYSAPVFLSEFGCNTNGVRSFHQVKAIFGPDMEDTFSGGIVYEYSEEPNNYGLVTISSDGQVTKRPCYQNLKQELASVNPTILKEASYTPSPERTPSQCPAISATWLASTNIPPTPSEELCASMMNSLKCVYSKKAGTTPNMGKLFTWLCGQTSCTDIAEDGKTGAYGKYSGCTADQRLSYMFNEYYTKNGENPKTCDFQGLGAIVTPSDTIISSSSSSSTETTQTSTTTSSSHSETKKTTSSAKTSETAKSTATSTEKTSESPKGTTESDKTSETHKSDATETNKTSVTEKTSEVQTSTDTEVTSTSSATESEKTVASESESHIDTTKSDASAKTTTSDKATETHKDTTVVTTKSDASDKITTTDKATETHKTTATENRTHESHSSKSTETHKSTAAATTKSDDIKKTTTTDKATETHKTTATENHTHEFHSSKSTETHKATTAEAHKTTDDAHKPIGTCIPSTLTVTKVVTVSASAPTEVSCVNGAYKCVDSGKSDKFTVCANGRIITNVCAPGTVCKTFEGSIICDWA